MANMPQVGVDVTPGENSSAFLRWLAQNSPGSGAAWQGQAPSLADQLTSDAPAVTSEAAPVGRIAGKIGNVKAFASDLGAVKSGDMSIAEFLGEHGTGVGLGAGLAAQLAAKPIGNFLGSETNNQDFGNMASSAIKGAGIGAGIGAMGGPLDFISVPVGALGGAAIGALLGSKHKASPAEQQANQESQIWNAMGSAGVDPQTLKSVQNEYSVLKATDPTRAQNYLGQVYNYAQQNQTLPGLPSTAAGGLSPQNILQLQTAITGLYAPYVQAQQKANSASIDQFMAAATPAGQKISAATQHLGDMYKQSGNAIANSYILQAQGEPALDALTNQYYQKGVTAATTGAGSSGGIASLLAGNSGLTAGASSSQASVSPALTASQYGAGNQLLMQ